MSKLFPRLFEPLSLRHKTLKHRLNFGAHTANMAEGGLPGERHLGYYTERALGGAAMIVVEPIPAVVQIELPEGLTERNKKAAEDSLAELQRVAVHGGNIFEQLMETAKVATLGQMSQALYEVGGQYRRNM